MKKSILTLTLSTLFMCGLGCSKHESPSTKSLLNYQLNITGITWGANYPKGNNSSCEAKLTADQNQKQINGDILKYQDCNTAKDILVKLNTKKTGFFYTKINEKGEKLDANATSWNCVLDENSGLLWEIKNQTTSTRHNADDTFTWYSGNVKTNGGDVGDWNSEFAKCAGYIAGQPETYCNINEFVNRVNSEGWCGFTDWRIPNRQELESIVNYGKDSPTINVDYFPDTKNEIYWSQSPTAENSKNAWGVNFRLGYSEWQMRSNPQRARLVRNWKSREH